MPVLEKKTVLPALGRARVSDPKSVQQLLDGVYTTLQVGVGRQGSQLDRFLTVRDLYEAGVIRLLDGQGYVQNTNGGNSTGFTPIPTAPEAKDLTAPPAPTGLAVTGAITINILTWTAAAYGNHAYTEIWRNSTDNQGTAVKIGTTRASRYSDGIGYNSSTWYYWIRFVSTADVIGAYNATAGTSGTTQSSGGGTDTTAPGAITGLAASGGVKSIILTWTLPSDNDINVVEIHRHTANDRDAGGSVIAKVKGTIYADPVAAASTYYYWVRAVDSSGNVGAWNAAATSGVSGTTGGVATADLIDAAVVTAKLADSAVVTAKLAAGAVDTTKLGDLAVTAAKLAQITDSSKLADALITNSKLANLAVDAAKLADSAVTATKIANLAVGTAAIADAAITSVKVGTAAIGSAAIANLAVGTAHIQDAAIQTAKIGDAQILNAKIADGAITNAKIADATILNAKIADATIDDAKIATLSASKLIAGTITSGVVNVGDDRFQLDGTGTNRHLLVRDNQGTPVNRVKIGKLGAGATDYGLQVFDASGNPVIAIDGTIYGAKINELAASKVLAGKLSGHDIVGAWFSTVDYDYTASSPQYTNAAYRVEIEDGSTLPIWYGNGTKNTTNGKFYVDQSGNVVVNGKLYSTEGTLGGFSLSAAILQSINGANTVGITSAPTGNAQGNSLFIGTTGAPEFKVTPAGICTAVGLVATSANISGTITIGAGSGYANLSDKPTSLSGINGGEGSKLSGIEAGADVTAGKTAGRGVNICHPRYSTFEEGVLPPVAYSGANGSVSLNGSLGMFGSKSLTLVSTSTDHYCYLGASGSDYNIKLTPNKKWIISGYVRSATSNAPGQLAIQTSNVGTQYRPAFTCDAAPNTWKRVYALIDASADVSASAVMFVVNSGNGFTINFDGLMIEEQVGTLTTPSVYNEPGAPISALQSGLELTSGYIKNGENINIDFLNKRISINSPVFGNTGIQIGYYGHGSQVLVPSLFVGNATTGSLRFDSSTLQIGNENGIVVDITNKRFFINDGAWGSSSPKVIFEDNGGLPRFYVGNGVNKFIQFDGIDVSLGMETKLLGADAYNNENDYWQWSGDSIDCWDSSIIGSGGVITATSEIRSSVLSAAGSSMQIKLRAEALWSKPFRLKFYAKLSDIPNVGYEINFGRGDVVNGVGRKVIFRVKQSSLNLYGVTANGVTENEISLAVTMTANIYHKFEIEFTPGVSAKFYVNDALVGTQTFSLPSGPQYQSQVYGQRLTSAGSSSGTLMFYSRSHKFLQYP